MPFPWLAVGSAAGAAGFVAYAAGCPRSQIWGSAVCQGDPSTRSIALSFDDGPSDATLDVLEALDRYQAKATFFVCGRNVDRRPELLRAVAAGGHEIANHTYSHPNLLWCGPQRVQNEVRWTQWAVENACGITPRWFRPPYGIRGPALPAALDVSGLRCVLWSVIGHDWHLPAEAIVRRVAEGVRPGAILCLHDGEDIQPRADRRQTVAALHSLLGRLAAEGLMAAPLSAMAPPAVD